MVNVLEIQLVLNVELDYAVKRLQQQMLNVEYGRQDVNLMENNVLIH